MFNDARIDDLISSAKVRIGLVAVASALGGYLIYSHIGRDVFGLPLPLVAALFYGVGIAITTTILVSIFPGALRIIEYVAMSRLLVGLVAANAPGLAYAMITSPLLTATLVVGLAIGLGRLVGSGLLDRWLLSVAGLVLPQARLQAVALRNRD